MANKAMVRITISLELDLNKEYSYQAVTRLENEIHNHINMGMLAAMHPEDAMVSEVNVSSTVEDI